MRILNENPRLDLQSSNLVYDHPLVLEHLFSQGHKSDNAAAIYGDRILFNKNFSCKAFYEFSKFIYVVRSPKSVLNEMIKLENFQETNALRYYQFRLRRIYEMCRSTPGAVYLTWDDLQKEESLPLVAQYLKLKEPLRFEPYPQFTDSASSAMEEAQDSYERHLFQIKQLDLIRLSQ